MSATTAPSSPAELDLHSMAWFGALRARSPAVARACATAGLLLLVAGAWLSFPRTRPYGPPAFTPLRIFVVDASAGCVRRRSHWERWIGDALASSAREADARGMQTCVIAFAAEVARVFGPAPARALFDSNARASWIADSAGLRDGGGDLARALDLVVRLVREREGARCEIVLAGDGAYTGRDPRPLLDALRERGATLAALDLPPVDIADVALGDVEIPRTIEIGAPLAAACAVFFAPAAGRAIDAYELAIIWTIEDEHGVRSVRSALAIPPDTAPDREGYIRFPAHVDLGPAVAGRIVIRAAAQLRERTRAIASSDAIVENDTSTTSLVCAGRLVVGALAHDAAGRSFLHELARGSDPTRDGLQIEDLAPQALGATLGDLDVLVTLDVSPQDLPCELVQSFVERGGGWLAFAGFDFLAGFVPSSVPRAPALVDLLPLAPPAEDRAPRDIVFVIDGSGSMSGAPFEGVRTALENSLPRAPPNDVLALRFFSGGLSPAIELSPSPKASASDPSVARRDALRRLYAARAPGGPTHLWRSLEQLAEERERAVREGRSREALVLLASDGRDTSEPDPHQRARTILDRLHATRARLVVIAAGADSDRETLSSLVAPGERLLDAGSLDEPQAANELARLFQRELVRDRVREDAGMRVRPAPLAVGATSLAAQLQSAQGVELAAQWPPIERCVRARPARGAEVVWVESRGDPLLAVQAVGLGTTAACMFAPLPEWAPGFGARADLFRPLVRALGRRNAETRVHIAREEDDIVITGLPPATPALLLARVFAADAAGEEAPLVEIEFAPPRDAVDPRTERRAQWPPALDEHDVPAAFRVEIRALNPTLSPHSIQLPLDAPRAAEFRLPARHVDFAREGPSATAPPAIDRDHGIERAHPAAPVLLASGLVLLACAALLGFFSTRAR